MTVPAWQTAYARKPATNGRPPSPTGCRVPPPKRDRSSHKRGGAGRARLRARARRACELRRAREKPFRPRPWPRLLSPARGGKPHGFPQRARNFRHDKVRGNKAILARDLSDAGTSINQRTATQASTTRVMGEIRHRDQRVSQHQYRNSSGMGISPVSYGRARSSPPRSEALRP